MKNEGYYRASHEGGCFGNPVDRDLPHLAHWARFEKVGDYTERHTQVLCRKICDGIEAAIISYAVRDDRSSNGIACREIDRALSDDARWKPLPAELCATERIYGDEYLDTAAIAVFLGHEEEALRWPKAPTPRQ